MVKIKNDLLESIQEFTLLDDPFMTKVFEDDIERTQFLLRIILKNDKIKVKKASTQKRIKNLQGRDLQLDILAEKANGQKFNVEVQNADAGAIPERARYHMSLLDAKSLPKSRYFDKLPENYVIFITKNDVLKDNLPIYHIHRTVDENGKSFNDGSHIIYVNSQIQDETPLGRLMHDFHCQNPDDMHYKELAEKARYFKQDEEGIEKMGDVMEKLMAKREKEAVERTKKEMGDVMEKLMAKREKETVERTKKEMGDVMEKLMAKREKEAVERTKKEMGDVMEKLMAKREKEAAEKVEKAKTIEFAQSLLAENETVERIARLTKLSLKEVRKIAEKMSA